MYKPRAQSTGLSPGFGGGGGNRTHVRGTSVAGFSVCSRLFHLTPWSVSWRPSAGPARKISATAVGRDGNPAHLTTSISDRRAEPREGRGYLRSQCVVVIGSCSCLHPINERVALDTLPTTEIVPRQNRYAPDSTVRVILAGRWPNALCVNTYGLAVEFPGSSRNAA